MLMRENRGRKRTRRWLRSRAGEDRQRACLHTRKISSSGRAREPGTRENEGRAERKEGGRKQEKGWCVCSPSLVGAGDGSTKQCKPSAPSFAFPAMSADQEGREERRVEKKDNGLPLFRREPCLRDCSPRSLSSRRLSGTRRRGGSARVRVRWNCRVDRRGRVVSSKSPFFRFTVELQGRSLRSQPARKVETFVLYASSGWFRQEKRRRGRGRALRR
jgi:hypothetical protein